jgi:hypothetical protein
MPAMPTHRPAPAEARAMAAALVAVLAEQSPSSMRLGAIDLGPALEQRLFFAIRDGSAAAPSRVRAVVQPAIGLGQALAALTLSLLPRRRAKVGQRPIVALIRQPARMRILGPIDAALRDRGAEPIAIVTVGQAAGGSDAGRHGTRLTDLLVPRAVAGVAAYTTRLRPGLAGAEPAWSEIVGQDEARVLRGLAEAELPLVAIGAAGIRSAIERWRPSLLVAFDEVGTWSRILPAAARVHGVPTLNLPHAEAADPVAIAGAAYDRFAVFGPRAAAVLRDAGIDAARIVETGAPNFDALAVRPRPEPDAGQVAGTASDGSPRPRRILLAAQYVHRGMTRDALEACHRGALAAARAVASAEVVVLPHPLQAPGQIEAIVGGIAPPPGVAVRVEHDAGLHDCIDGAWLLVTGWSNSVFEAALRGVPSLMVDPEHRSPVRYAEEGLGIAADTEAGAEAAARALLDPARRRATLERSAAALEQHLGASDGGASARTASLMLAMARPGAGSESPTT